MFTLVANLRCARAQSYLQNVDMSQTCITRASQSTSWKYPDPFPKASEDSLTTHGALQDAVPQRKLPQGLVESTSAGVPAAAAAPSETVLGFEPLAAPTPTKGVSNLANVDDLSSLPVMSGTGEEVPDGATPNTSQIFHSGHTCMSLVVCTLCDA